MEIKSKEIKNNEDESKENKDIFESCSGLTPLKLVDSIERNYHSIVTKSEQNNFRILSNFKNLHGRIFDLIDFETIKQNSKIIEKIKDISCIKIVQDYIFLGLKNFSSVYMYQIETGRLEKEFYEKDNDEQVSVINTKDNLYLLVGYEEGCIIIFDIKNNSN